MISLNTYAVTQPALEEIGPGEDGFTYDVTSWLHDGINTLTVVLIGPPGDLPFRMIIAQGEEPEHILDEATFLPLATHGGYGRNASSGPPSCFDRRSRIVGP